MNISKLTPLTSTNFATEHLWKRRTCKEGLTQPSQRSSGLTSRALRPFTSPYILFCPLFKSWSTFSHHVRGCGPHDIGGFVLIMQPTRYDDVKWGECLLVVGWWNRGQERTFGCCNSEGPTKSALKEVFPSTQINGCLFHMNKYLEECSRPWNSVWYRKWELSTSYLYVSIFDLP